jgi:hypothetical protein
MRGHPLDLLRLIFVVLIAALVIAGLTTSARPRTARQWTLVWLLMTFLAWALLGFGWLRA